MIRIRTLDGWRAIAILMVTVNHAAESIWGHRPDILEYTRAGSIGVDVFFALSGLLITKLLIEEHDTTGGLNVWAFYVRRLFRVVLPCYAYLAVLGFVSLIHSRAELVSSLLFFRNYIDPHTGGFYTAHLWTLAVEEHFYILWPLALMLVSVRYGQQLAICGAIACALWRTLSFHFVPMLFGNAILLWRTDYRLDSLFWGCAFAYVLHDRARLKYIIYGTVVYVACVGLNSPTQRLCMPIMLPFAMVITATHGEWLLSKLLDSRVMTWIAKISYSLYLWQMLFLVRGNDSNFLWQRFPANLFFTLLTATVCYYVIDLPLQRTGRRLSRQFDANRRDIMRRCSAAF